MNRKPLPHDRDPRPEWLAERDRMNEISHEAASGRQPVSDPVAPSHKMRPSYATEMRREPRAPDPRAPTSDQLRARIDRGEARDKVSAADPAAAPLGTDAEAGGHPPTAQERAMESTTMRSLTPARRQQRWGWQPAGLVIAAALILAALLVATGA